MRIFKPMRQNSGQALLETVLVMPLMLFVILNVINFGYFFLVSVNLAASPRTGVEYSILGFATPGSLTLPSAGPPNSQTTVSYVSQQDMVGALDSPTGASIQVCTSTVGVNIGPPQTAKCVSCTGITCGAPGTGNPAPPADPESNFILNQVDVTYSFSPIIPGTPFGLVLLPFNTCSSSGGTVTCTFHRQVLMREMN